MKEQGLKYLPEPHTEFVLSGDWEVLLGIVALLALTIWLVGRRRSRRRGHHL